MKFTKKEKEQKDEIILAAIVAASESIGRKVQPHYPHRGVEGSHEAYISVDVAGPCCAVGAGVLYAGLTKLTRHNLNNAAVRLFARAYGVSYEYAEGVSHGFEGFPGDRRGSAEEHRGYAVGVAAFEALYPEAES